MNRKPMFSVGILCALLFANIVLKAQLDTVNQKVMTFEQAADLLELNNYTIKQSQKYIEQKKMELHAARGLFLPQISLGANYALLSEDIHLDLTPVKEAILPLYETLGNYGNFSGVPNPDPNTQQILPTLPDDISTQVVRDKLLAGAEELNTADWNTVIQKKQFGVVSARFALPVYTGGKILAANKVAKVELQEAQTKKDLKQEELFCQLVTRYYGLVLSAKVLEVREQVLQTMIKHVGDAEKLKTHGMIADAEFLHAKVYHSQALREYKRAKRQHQIVNQALLNTLSLDTSILIKPVSKLFYKLNLEAVESYISSAHKHSLQLQMVAYNKEKAKENYKMQKTSFLPNIAAAGSYDIANKDLSEMVPEYMLGVGMSWNVFSGASRYHKLKKAQTQLDQIDHFYAQTTLDIEMAISKYYQELNMQLEQLADLEQAKNFAAEYFRVRQKAFAEGMATTTEVSDANLALAKVEIEQLQAMYNYDVALAKLLFFSGRLQEFSNYQLTGNTKL